MPDKLRSSLLAPFYGVLLQAATTSSQTHTVIRRLLKQGCRAEGISQFECVLTWNAARDLYHGGYFALRELPCNPHLKLDRRCLLTLPAPSRYQTLFMTLLVYK